MNPKLFISLTLVSFLLFSCKKEFPPTTIKGHISEYFSNVPLGNISLRICDVTVNPQSPQLLGKYENIYDSLSYDLKINADKDGNFELTTDKLGKGKNYVLVFWDRKYITSEAYIIKPGETNNIEVKLRPIKILKVTTQSMQQQKDFNNIRLTLTISDFLYLSNNNLEPIVDQIYILSENMDTTIYTDAICAVSYKMVMLKFNDNTYVDRAELVQYIDNIDTTSVVMEY